MSKAKRSLYTLEYKQEAVRLVLSGRRPIDVAKELRLSSQTLSNWLRAHHEGRLGGVGSKLVTPEQMELSRLRAENARLRMERDILKKATAYFAKSSL